MGCHVCCRVGRISACHQELPASQGLCSGNGNATLGRHVDNRLRLVVQEVEHGRWRWCWRRILVSSRYIWVAPVCVALRRGDCPTSLGLLGNFT